MKKWKLILILFFVFLYACHKNINPYEIGPEEYKIYKTIIDKFYMESDCALIVIKSELLTAPQIYQGYWNSWFTLLTDTYTYIKRDFSSKTEEMRQLKNKFPLETPYVLINYKEIDSFSYHMDINHSVIWKQFYKKFPKSLGFITFSPIGFNKEQNTALVFFKIRKDIKNAFSAFVILEKRKALMNTWCVCEKYFNTAHILTY